MLIRNKILIIFIFYISQVTFGYSQDTIKKRPFYIPQTTSINMNSNFHWFISEGIHGNWSDRTFIDARLKYSRYMELVVTNQITSPTSNLQNQLTDFYFNYRNDFKANSKIPIFKYGSTLDVKVGVIQWFPTYTNVQLIFDNVEKFINPSQIYGGYFASNIPLTRDKSLNIRLGAHTGDLISHDFDAELLDLNINYTKIFKYSLGISTQIGIAQGSRHVVNFAHLLYQPKIEKIQLNVKIGKLISIDDTPYGIHIGINRNFKFLSLGGFYERRINQKTRGEIAGISWRIIGPPKLAKFINTFSLFYDINTNAIWMWIPILKINIQ